MENRAGKEAATAMKIFRTVGKICTVVEMRYGKKENERSLGLSNGITGKTDSSWWFS
jgi:hypothetical protein